jgi:hypothetical protein
LTLFYPLFLLGFAFQLLLASCQLLRLPVSANIHSTRSGFFGFLPGYGFWPCLAFFPQISAFASLCLLPITFGLCFFKLRRDLHQHPMKSSQSLRLLPRAQVLTPSPSVDSSILLSFWLRLISN